jgi:hypothetical protein
MYRILHIMRRLMLFALAGAAACQTAPQTSETDQEITTISTTLLDFGSPQVGTTTGNLSGYIRESTHAGDYSETITGVTYNGSSSPTACPDFTLNASIPGYVELDCETTCFVMCPVGQICTPYDYDFSANFHPSIAADESCAISFQIASGAKNVTLHGIGAPPPIHVTAAPGSIAFGGVRITTDSTGVNINVANSGGAAATINSASVGAGYTITAGTTGSHSLGPNANENYTVVCHPTALGAVNGTFSLSSNDPNTPLISIGMTCSGTDSALAVSPSPAVLPTLRVGETEQKTISITNMGAAATSLQAVTVSGMTMVSAPAPGTPLAANGGATSATIEFDATVKGDVSGTMHIDYDNGKSLDTAITGKAVDTTLSLTPDGDVDFGQVCVGQTKLQMFSLVATDEGSFKLTAASTPDAPFTLTPPTLPATVQGSAANTVTFSVTAAPTDEGDATSMIALTTDIPNGTPHVINVHALGLSAGVNGPAQVDLGGNPINETSIGQHVEISNCTAAPISITTVALSGMDAGEFAIVDQPDNSTIAPAGSATWLVVLQAHTVGLKSASFDAMTDSGTTTSVPLIGEGLGSGSGGTDGGVDNGKDSYYACSTGRASSLWPIAVALGLLIRRRKR